MDHGTVLSHDTLSIGSVAQSSTAVLGRCPSNCPERGELHDPPEVQKLVALNLVENRDPRDYCESARRAFYPRLKQLFQSRRGILPPPTLHDGPFLPPGGEVGVPGGGRKSVWIHAEKMGSGVAVTLEEYNLARREGPWIEVEPVTGGLYMMALAAAVGRAFQSPLVTDSFDRDVAGIYLNTEDGDLKAGVAAEMDHVALARMLAPFPSPEDMRDIAIEVLVEFRTKHARERRRFRHLIHEAASRLNKRCSSIDAYRDGLRDLKSQIEQELDVQRQMFDELGVRTLNGALTLSVPSGLAISLVPHPYNYVVSGVGFAFAIVGWYAKYREEKRKISERDWHYLIPLGRTFPNSNYLDLAKGMRDLMFPDAL